MPFSNKEIQEFCMATAGDGILSAEEPFGMLTLEVTPSALIPLVKALKEHPSFAFTFMTDLCGLHMPEQTGRELGVVYMFHAWASNSQIRVKTFVPESDPQVPSMTVLFNSANWMERETYDFYGIHFQGHPNLRRILNVDDMDYFPLRKQYPLEDQIRRDKVDEMFGR